jgi:hypothetical protein
MTAKTILGVMAMATLMSALFGCRHMLDRSMADTITAQLSAEYGKSFTVYAIGDRYDRDSARALVYANEDPTLCFTAFLGLRDKKVVDNYKRRRLGRQAENLITAIFAEHGIEVTCYAEAYAPTKPISAVASADTPLVEYIEAATPEGFSISTAVKSTTIKVSTVEEIYKKIYSELHNTTLATAIYLLDSTDYEIVAPKIKKDVNDFGADRLSQHGAVGQITEIFLYYDGTEITSYSHDLNEEVLHG